MALLELEQSTGIPAWHVQRTRTRICGTGQAYPARQSVAAMLRRHVQPTLAGTALFLGAPFQGRQAHGGVNAPAVLDGCHAGASTQMRDDEVHLALLLAQQPGSLHAQVAACLHSLTVAGSQQDLGAHWP